MMNSRRFDKANFAAEHTRVPAFCAGFAGGYFATVITAARMLNFASPLNFCRRQNRQTSSRYGRHL